MNPCVLFLNGPECPSKLLLLQKFKEKFSEEEVCIYLNRKNLLSMFNSYSEEKNESFEWILQKILKNIVNNGVYVIFDVFLPTRRMNQYALQLKGLPCYWLGIFIKDKSEDFSEEFYDLSVVVNPDLLDFSNIVDDLFTHVSKNDPCCFTATRSVEKKPRKRLIFRQNDTEKGNSFDVSSNNSEKHFDEDQRKNVRNFSNNSVKNGKNSLSRLRSKFNQSSSDKDFHKGRFEYSKHNGMDKNVCSKRDGIESKYRGTNKNVSFKRNDVNRKHGEVDKIPYFKRADTNQKDDERTYFQKNNQRNRNISSTHRRDTKYGNHGSDNTESNEKMKSFKRDKKYSNSRNGNIESNDKMKGFKRDNRINGKNRTTYDKLNNRSFNRNKNFSRNNRRISFDKKK